METFDGRGGIGLGIADGVGLGEISMARLKPTRRFFLSSCSKTLEGRSAQRDVRGAEIAVIPTALTGQGAGVRSFSERDCIVLFDSRPILAVSDALFLGGIVDGILLVIGAGSADRDEVRRAKEQLEPIGTPIIGAVLNQFDPKLHGRPNQPYRGYYLDPRR
jgi:hypothetical protein